ncbi:DUF4957 domain-containing protein [Sphingobacterium alkalisoli]|uniref:DUF4957 domain-containing protein n=1 Tax=Sphingobacterium alkalisoli TaxID=1874115 RepID=A0A4V5LYU1_9SPHI|nr:DUF4957 domain-containing protein [Sphingobacterium alkalisoli]TJY67919.1 DUF4957 domain-containing protein [Sphingobacterium alkalisoli]
MMKFQKINPLRLFYRTLLFVFVIAAINACNKETVYPPVSLTQMTSGIAIAHADTSLTLTWDHGVAAWEGNSRQAMVSYAVQVSTDSTFSDVSQNVFDFETDSTSLFLGDEEITPLQKYFARVRTVSNTGTGFSEWRRTPSFQLKPIDLFTPIKVWKLSHEAVVLNFGRHGELTKMVVEKEDGTDSREFNVSNDELITMQLDGLTSNTGYVARLFRHDDRSLGELTFTTKPTVEEAGYIDLRGSSDPQILQNTLNTVPDGSTIALKRGMAYTITETFKLNRGVTITSEPGFGEQAQIIMSSSFDVDAPSPVELIKFEDVKITGNIGGSYVFNLSAASSINRIEFEACIISDQRGVLRMKDPGVKTISKYVVNNSIVQNIGGYGVLAVDHVDARVDNVELTNSTFINAQWIVRYNSSVVNHLNAMTIESSTFFQAPNDNRYVLDMARTGSTIGSFTANNTLFGYTGGGRSFNSRTPASVSGTSSFATSDATWGTSATQGLPAAGIIRSSLSSEQVFAAPDKTNFTNSNLTIIEETLFTVGDPRWRP